MIDSIYIGMSGLTGFSDALRVIANNTTNLNTPGYKSTSMTFSDAFYARSGSSGGGNSGTSQMGSGLAATGTKLSFKQGDFQQTGNDLDVAIDGEGLFTLQNADGSTAYTRTGQFNFNPAGTLVNAAGAQVMGIDSSGNSAPIVLTGLKTQAGKATTTITFDGNLPSTATTAQTVNGVKVIDAAGGEHNLSLSLTNTGSTTAGSWHVDVLDGTTNVGSGQLIFANGSPTAGNSQITLSYTPAGQAAVPLTLDFSNDVTSFASGTLSTLAFGSQDGFAAASMSGASFDAAGVLVITYANGQTAKGARLSLSRFDSPDAVRAIGGNQFVPTNSGAWHAGTAGGSFGSIKAGSIELSNVDLSQEFSNLVIMQRGYQASSQIVSTANEMLQELFSMKGA